MVLWRSDVVHNNYGGDMECFEGQPGHTLCRLVQMVCLCPRSARDATTKERKESCWDTMEEREARQAGDKKRVKWPIPGASTSHYPHICIPAGPGHMSNPKESAAHWRTYRAKLLPEQRELL